MLTNAKKILSTTSQLFLILLLVGCQQEKPSETLRIAVLPILDTLPMYVAEAEGMFTTNGIKVEFIPAASAAERDQLLQAGQVDGVITDLVALALYNREQTEVIAVRYAMIPTDRFAQFRILAAAESDITSPIHLKGVSIGISEGTVIEYVTTRLLEREALNLEQISLLPVPKIPERMALLNAGELKAATLPEPLASLVMQQGAVVIADDTQHQDLSCSIYAFRKDFIEANTKTIQKFLTSISQASAAINADKNRWEGLLVENKLVPAPLIGEYTLPDYPDDSAPTAKQYDDVVDWLIMTQRLEDGPAYSDVVESTLLPNGK
jgi:NitT/TauT family transport system substrate-binding protein